MVKRMTSAKHSPKRIHSMKKNARPSSDRTADGDRDREIRLIVVDDAPRAASGEPAGVRATPVIIFLVVARGSSRSQIFIVRSSDRVVARGSEAPRAAKRRRRGWLTAERGAWVSCHREFRLGGGSVGRPRVLETRVGAKKHENIRLDRSTRVRSTRAARKVRDGVGQRRPREGRHDPREATTGR